MAERRATKAAWLVLGCLALAGCNPAFHDLGVPPPLSAHDGLVHRVGLMDRRYEPQVIMADDRTEARNPSIWSDRYGILFRDNRAYEVGDILTVSIDIDESANFASESERESTLDGSLDASGAAEFDGRNPSGTVTGSLGLKSDAKRGGAVNRSERIRLSIAAIVTRVFSNGNIEIAGSQEIRVNHELRVLNVSGIVRLADILPDNTVPYDKMAEARISYGGHNTRLSKPGYRPFLLGGPARTQQSYGEPYPLPASPPAGAYPIGPTGKPHHGGA